MDFYLPDHNIVIELLGPTHYIKPDMKEMNTLTKFKFRILEEIKVKLIALPFDSGKRYGKEVKDLLLDYLKESTILKE